MDKKLLLVVVVAVILIVVGTILIVTNPLGGAAEDSSDIPLKSNNFKHFSVDVPEGSNFTIKNQASGMKYYQNNGEHSKEFSGIIINKNNMTDFLIGDNPQPISNSSSEQIYSNLFKNETIYKYVSLQDDVDVILTGNDLNLLKEIAGTIEVKDVSNL